MATYIQIFGWTDEVTACDCCGKTDLSGTFCVELESGETVHYGSVCVLRNGGFSSRRYFNKAAEKALNARVKAARIRYRHTPEYLASEARFAEAHRLVRAGQLEIGAPFRAFVAEAAEAAERTRNAFADLWKVKAYEL